ncbi:MAG TPA: stage V sporulation protein AD [Pseudogracilibacillus sp.]|nr:stage V sporulation protein AD [Pseudogracilibacillus sp.]
MLVGRNSWQFSSSPTIISSGVVIGKEEAMGNLQKQYDKSYEDMFINEKSFEAAQQVMMEEAIEFALQKGNITSDKVNFFLSGDLINQISPTTFAAKTTAIPYFGLFNACATSTESLALSAMIMEAKGANYIISGTASHYAATERQFRFPNEYGGQIPPTAQRTITGAGTVLIGKQGNGPKITRATIGKVVDMGVTDPFNMGGAMAPAAVDTILQHFKDFQLDATHYDLILTGDLGTIGREVTETLLTDNNIQLKSNQYIDCGEFIFKKEQKMNAGGSGAACSSVVTYGYFLNELMNSKIKRLLFVATGALHSPLSVQQKNSIPCIAHAVALERV